MTEALLKESPDWFYYQFYNFFIREIWCKMQEGSCSSVLKNYKIYLAEKSYNGCNIDDECYIVQCIENKTPQNVLYNANSEMFNSLIESDDFNFNEYNIELLKSSFLMCKSREKDLLYTNIFQYIDAFEFAIRK